MSIGQAPSVSEGQKKNEKIIPLTEKQKILEQLERQLDSALRYLAQDNPVSSGSMSVMVEGGNYRATTPDDKGNEDKILHTTRFNPDTLKQLEGKLAYINKLLVKVKEAAQLPNAKEDQFLEKRY